MQVSFFCLKNKLEFHKTVAANVLRQGQDSSEDSDSEDSEKNNLGPGESIMQESKKRPHGSDTSSDGKFFWSKYFSLASEDEIEMRESKIRQKKAKKSRKKRDRVESPGGEPENDVSGFERDAMGEPDSVGRRNKYPR